jgi:hypothetical protein
MARCVTFGWLDLDDVRSEVAEQHGAVGPGQNRGAVDDEQARQRAG